MRIAQQIDTKLMHPCEKSCQNPLVKFHFIEDFDLLIQELKQRNIFSLVFVVVKNLVKCS